MVDPVTNNRSITLPTVGGDSGTWGTIQNSGVFSQLDLILGATQAVAITVSDVTLSQPQWNNAAISLSGTLTADRSLVLPLSPNSATAAVGGYFVVENLTAGAFNVTVKTAASGSTGVKAPQGLRTWFYSNGTNVSYADDSKVFVATVSGTPNGQLAGTAATVNNPPNPFAYDYTNKALYVPTTTGTAASTVWQKVLLNSAPTPTALFASLVIKVLTNTTASVAATGVSVTDGSGNYLIVAPSSTINFATTGANGIDTGSIATSKWYAIWTIAKADGTTACLASLSSTFGGLTLPSGYTFGSRVGWVRTASAVAQLMGTWQLGRDAQYVVGLAQTATVQIAKTGVGGDAAIPTWVAVSVSNYVPTTASKIRVNIQPQGSVAMSVAPNSSYGNNSSLTNPPPLSMNPGNVAAVELVLESTNVSYACSSAAASMGVLGWTDNI